MSTYAHSNPSSHTSAPATPARQRGNSKSEQQNKLTLMAGQSSSAIQLKRLTQSAAQSPVIQRIAQLMSPEEEEPLQGKFASEAIQRKETSPSGGGLPPTLKSGVEQLSGVSMDDVNVTYNSSKPAQLSALAYAKGTDIHLAAGQEKHLPHEAWHVAQQKAGRVKPTTSVEGVAVNDDPQLEKEADVMGAKANTVI